MLYGWAARRKAMCFGPWTGHDPSGVRLSTESGREPATSRQRTQVSTLACTGRVKTGHAREWSAQNGQKHIAFRNDTRVKL